MKYKKSKVLFFHPSNDFTGSTRVLYNIINQEYCSENVTIITNKGEGFLSKLNNAKIVNTWQPYWKGKPIKFVSYVIWFSYSIVLSFIYGFRFPIFYINTTQPVYAAIVGSLMRKKIIYHVHEVFPKFSMTGKFIRFVFHKTIAHRIFVSYYTKSQFKENKRCTWEVKYNKLSSEFLTGIDFNPIENRKRDTLLMLSCLDKKKGLFTLLDVAKKMPEYTFILVISSERNKIGQFFARENPLPENLKIYPAQSNIHPFLHKTDVVLNLSNPAMVVETFGMTILEGMAYGIPSIVPNIGGPTELIKDGYNGYCIDVTDTNIVVKTIKKTMERNNYNDLANHSLEMYKKYFS